MASPCQESLQRLEDYSAPVLPLNAGPWEEFFAVSPAKPIKTGTVFSFTGPDQGLYFIESGRIRFFLLSVHGTEKTFCIVGPGGTFGETNVVDAVPTRWLAEAQTDLELRFIPIPVARQLMEKRPDLSWPLMEAMARRLRMAGKQMEDQCFRTVPSRVACIILAMADRPASDDARNLPLTHDDIAHFIGSNRVTVTRALRSMRSQGLIDYDRNLETVIVLDREGLTDLAEEQL